MTLPNLNLDDKTFEELVEEAKKLIPIYAPEWTDNSIHDPGITLIELFAWISEMQLYYLNQITEKNKAKFLNILGDIEKDLELDSRISIARKDIDKIYSAITPDDYEYLVHKYLEDKCLVGDENKLEKCKNPTTGLNLAKTEFRVKTISDLKNQIMKVIVVPKSSPVEEDIDLSDVYQILYKEIYMYLDEFRLIGTPLYVGGPKFVGVSIGAELSVKDRYNTTNVKNDVESSLETFLHPFEGGILKKGWSFGRGVFKSEIYKILTGVNGVECVSKLEIIDNNDGEGNLLIRDNELVFSKAINITIISNIDCKRRI